jgi:DNA-3-methyladenine glycosylase II
MKIPKDTKEIIAHFEKVDPIIATLVKDYLQSEHYEQPTKADPKDYAVSLTSSIISQQISTKAAAKIKQRFFDMVGEDYNPQNILDHDIEQLRSVGLSRQKASYVHSIAQHTLDKSVEFNNLDSLTDREVIDELIQIKGVGVWTAEMFLIFTLARPDVFSTGDLGLVNAIKRLYNLENISQDELIEISGKWSPHKSIASLALWHSLDNMPK